MNININDIPAILGLSKTRSKEDVIRKMVRAANGINDNNQSFALDFYKNHIEQAISEYEIINGVEITDGLINGEIPIVIDVKKDGRIDRSISDSAYARCQYAISKNDAYKKCFYFQWSNADFKEIVVDRDDVHINFISAAIDQFNDDLSIELNNPDKCLASDRQEINTDHCQKLISEYDELKTSIDLAKEKIEIIINELSDMSDGRDMIICGRNFTKVTKQGSVSYSKIVKNHLPDIDLDEYRGEQQTYWRLS